MNGSEFDQVLFCFYESVLYKLCQVIILIPSMEDTIYEANILHHHHTIISYKFKLLTIHVGNSQVNKT